MSQYIYGIRTIIEAIESGKQIEKILLKKQFKSELLASLRQIAKRNQIPIQYVPVEKLNKITHQNHQGALAFVSPITFWPLDELVTSEYEKGLTPFLIVLDRVTDVHNFGAIVRTAECTQVTGIVIPRKNTAQLGGDAMKTSAGALNYVPIVRSVLSEALDQLHEMGFQIVAATEKGDHTIYEVDLTIPTALIMGSEEKGIAFELLKKSDVWAQIPVLGKIESLNVSVASAIFMYEAVRQRRFAAKSKN